MPWQDLGFTLGSIVFVITLLPTLRERDSVVPRSTSVPTAAVLFWFVFLYLTMGFWYSAVISAATGSTWLGIALWRAP